MNRYHEPPETVTTPANYVPALLEPRPGPIVPKRVDILPPEHVVDMPMPAAVQSVTRGSHLDRAQGFRHAMMPVAVVAGALGAIAGMALFGVPLLSFALLLWFMTVFCVTWLCGYALFTLTSADGVALITAIGMLRLLRHEQRARIRRMEGDE